MRNENELDWGKSILRLEEENRQLRREVEQLKARVAQLEYKNILAFQVQNSHSDGEEEELEEEDGQSLTRWRNEY